MLHSVLFAEGNNVQENITYTDQNKWQANTMTIQDVPILLSHHYFAKDFFT